jgi:hypothetical protein
MDTKAILYTKTKLNELAAQHNRLTTLCAFLLNEVSGLKKELQSIKSGDVSSAQAGSSSSSSQRSQSNFSELKAEEILKQLSINSVDN